MSILKQVICKCSSLCADHESCNPPEKTTIDKSRKTLEIRYKICIEILKQSLQNGYMVTSKILNLAGLLQSAGGCRED